MPQEVYHHVINVRIPMELHKKAAIAAIQRNITLNEFIK
ncbi:toxin-antitoxin system HicB family antitoxin [Chitinophaga caeni]